MKSMILAIALVLGMVGGSHSEPLSFDFGGTTLVLPLQVVNGTQMYSIDEERGFTGMESVVVKRGDFDLTLGAATGYGNGIQFPFIGAQIKLPSAFFDVGNNDLRFGVWLGRDYDANRTMWGLKGSVALW